MILDTFGSQNWFGQEREIYIERVQVGGGRVEEEGEVERADRPLRFRIVFRIIAAICRKRQRTPRHG